MIRSKLIEKIAAKTDMSKSDVRMVLKARTELLAAEKEIKMRPKA